MLTKDIFFYHIMKTAGTSIAKMLEEAYTQEPMCSLPTHECADDQLFRKKIQTEKPIIISGHPDHLFQLWEMAHSRSFDRFTFTFLRNPIDRYISCYFFLSRSNYVNKFVQEYTITLEQSLSCGNPKFADNIMTKILASLGSNRDYNKNATSEDFKIAIKNLRKMDFIGISEEFKLSFALLADKLNMNASTLGKWNVNKKYPKKEEIDPKIIQKIRLKNLYDLEIFHLATEIFKLQLSEASENVTKILNNLSSSNTIYFVKQKSTL